MNNPEQHLHTTVWYCTEKDFKNTVSRMILGVTHNKFSRKKGQYYQHNQHNRFAVRRLTDDLYAKLLELKDLSTYYVTVDFDISWNSTGKITGASGISVGIYTPVGKVTANELKVFRTNDKVKLDVFISDLDSGSKHLLNALSEIKKQYGEDSFEYQEHKLLNDADYKKWSDSYGVTYVPTILINEKKFENPSDSVLQSNVEVAINSAVFLEGIKLTRMK